MKEMREKSLEIPGYLGGSIEKPFLPNGRAQYKGHDVISYM